MIEVIVFFLIVSLTLYTVFGGADFGAGILELFWGKKHREKFRGLINHAIGPVWEANHIWIILVIVILFTGFPEAFRSISVTFHVPLTIMLVGIVLRGCAFTFRHYDAIQDDSQKYYSTIFAASSVLTPFSQGLIAGGLIMGRIPADPASFQEAYLLPWANIFCLSTGIFLCTLCALTAAVFLVCEDPEPELKPVIIKRVRQISLFTFLSGGAVFAAAEVSNFELLGLFFSNAVSLVCLCAAILSIIALNVVISRGQMHTVKRGLMLAITTLILCGWWHLQFPYLIGIPESSMHSLNIYDIAAPEPVLKQLIIALAVGCVIIFPALFFLFHTFKFSDKESG